MTPEQRAARIHYHEYSGEGIREHAERIVALEELVMDLWECPVDDSKCTDCPHCKEHYDVCAGECGCKLYDRMLELGVIE